MDSGDMWGLHTELAGSERVPQALIGPTMETETESQAARDREAALG